jgi:hypothetical protein
MKWTPYADFKLSTTTTETCKHGRYYRLCLRCSYEQDRAREQRWRNLKEFLFLALLFGTLIGVSLYAQALFRHNDGPKYRIAARDEGDRIRYVVQKRNVFVVGRYDFMWNHSHFSLGDARADIQQMLAEERRVNDINSRQWSIVE